MWLKKAKVPKKCRQEIAADLRGMSDLIEEAMDYTKERHGRDTAIRFLLKTEENSHSHYLQINYELGMKAWSVTIYRIQNTSGFPENFIGDIVSEKGPLCQTFYDEDYRVPDTI